MAPPAPKRDKAVAYIRNRILDDGIVPTYSEVRSAVGVSIETARRAFQRIGEEPMVMDMMRALIRGMRADRVELSEEQIFRDDNGNIVGRRKGKLDFEIPKEQPEGDPTGERTWNAPV